MEIKHKITEDEQHKSTAAVGEEVKQQMPDFDKLIADSMALINDDIDDDDDEDLEDSDGVKEDLQQKDEETANDLLQNDQEAEE